jgi:hypothetical protein
MTVCLNVDMTVFLGVKVNSDAGEGAMSPESALNAVHNARVLLEGEAMIEEAKTLSEKTHISIYAPD